MLPVPVQANDVVVILDISKFWSTAPVCGFRSPGILNSMLLAWLAHHGSEKSQTEIEDNRCKKYRRKNSHDDQI